MPKVKIPLRLCQTVSPGFDGDHIQEEDKKRIISAAKELITTAINEQYPLATFVEDGESGSGFHHNLTFPQPVKRQIISLSREHNLRDSQTCLNLLYSAIQKDAHLEFQPVSTESALSRYVTALGFSVRTHQTQLFEDLQSCYLHPDAQNGLSKGDIGMVEGATGIGKTLAMIASANEYALNTGERSCIATLTISNMKQFVTTYQQLVDADIEMVPLRVIFGRNSFVSLKRLTQFTEGLTPENQAAVKVWLASQDEKQDSPHVIPLYMVEDLIDQVPAIVTHEVTLIAGNDENDPGYHHYKAQFMRKELQPEIILCTQAMLALNVKVRFFNKAQVQHDDASAIQDQLNKSTLQINALMKKRAVLQQAGDKQGVQDCNLEMKSLIVKKNELYATLLNEEDIGLLPVYQYLLVDEAHMLEESFSNSFSTYQSLQTIRRNIMQLADAGTIGASVAKDVNHLVDKLVRLGDQQSNVERLSGKTVEFNVPLVKLCDTILNCRRMKSVQAYWVSELRELRTNLSKIHEPTRYAAISYSPVKRYPQIITGMLNIQKYLSLLWGEVVAGCCVSATLYFKKNNSDSAGYFRSVLCVPENRAREFTPIVPQWLKSPIKTICTPDPNSNVTKFMPPTRKLISENEDVRAAYTENWLTNIAETVSDIYQTAAGGVLVLMTAFSDVEFLSKKLTDYDDQLVISDGTMTLEQQKQRYLTLSKNGKRPLWLALGGAWTGLDVNGKHIGLNDAQIETHDNVITDLVIPKIPFGLNRSLAYLSRYMRSRDEGTLELMEASIRFKQGMGRLVRLAGQPANRRIFVLDGRLVSSHHKGYVAPIRRIIESYPSAQSVIQEGTFTHTG